MYVNTHKNDVGLLMKLFTPGDKKKGVYLGYSLSRFLPWSGVSIS